MHIDEFSKYSQGFDEPLLPDFLIDMNALSLDEYIEFVKIVDELERKDERFLSLSQFHQKALHKDKDYEKKAKEVIQKMESNS